MPRWMVESETVPEVVHEPEPEVEGDEPPFVDPPTDPSECLVVGLHAPVRTVKKTAEFRIEAYTSDGERKTEGGDGFFVAIRGAVRVRAKVEDHENGTYTVSWRPDVSGTYSVAVSLFGISIPGSPFAVNVHEPQPFPQKCEARGEALHSITARMPSTFEVRYRDRAGHVARAMELDVWVVPVLDHPANAECAVSHTAYDVARQAPRKVEAPKKLDPGKEKDDELRIRGRPRKGRRKSLVRANDNDQERPESPFSDDVPNPDDAGDGSADEDLITLAARTGARRRAIAIQILDKPLAVYSEHSLRAQTQIATLQPEQLATVIEERISADGLEVRAAVTFEEVLLASLESPRSHATARETLRGNNKSSASPLKSPVDLQVESLPQPISDALPSPTGGSGRGIGGGSSGGGSSNGGSPMVLQLSPSSPQSSPEELLKQSLPAPPAPRGLPRVITGWCVIKRGGRRLVTSRVRIEPWVRQQAHLLWKLQQLNDRLQRQLTTEAALLDPTGVGFAFGGVSPGWVHSKGQLHDAHKVSYSVDRIGKYLLHVRLRSSAQPVAGSPFALQVLPGLPHESETNVQIEGGMLSGEVGLEQGEGCVLLLHTRDRVGNVCNKGGGKVLTTTSLGDKLQSSVEDKDDGTYLITWRSRVTGTIDVKVLINKAQVLGSPFKICLRSTVPEIPKTIVEGIGLETAVAGKPTPIKLKLIDQYGNPCQPSSTFNVGLAITNSKKKFYDLTAHSDYSGAWTDVVGEFVVTYITNKVGSTDLHIWAEASSADPHAREIFPLSPFLLQVTAGPATPSNTYLDSWTIAVQGSTKSKQAKGAAPSLKEIADAAAAEAAAKETITAGDTVSVRAHCVDEFENAAHVETTELRAMVVAPDGERMEREVVDVTHLTLRKASGKEVAKQGASTLYEIRHETVMAGQYEMHVTLNGSPIKNSPVLFVVEPAAAVPAQSRLQAPPDDEELIADMERPTIVMLHTCDKFGNPCTTGGLRIAGRLQLVKQSATENTVLMQNNHAVTVEDKQNGTYEVYVTIMMSAVVKLTVNMDKDMPGSTGELPPLQLAFVKPSSAPEAALAAEVA